MIDISQIISNILGSSFASRPSGADHERLCVCSVCYGIILWNVICT